VHYYFSDELGSASVVTNASGNTYYYYYPYGGLVATVGSDPNHYKFTGKERDAETGNDYFDARYYANSMGRFMTPDWAAKPTAVPYASFGNPQSLNLYSYVNNNPTTTRDPDGHCPPGVDCSRVTVTSTPATQPSPVTTRTVIDKDGNPVTLTGPIATVTMTVRVDGVPTDGVLVTETNQDTTTVNGKVTPTPKPIEGAGATSGGGKFT